MKFHYHQFKKALKFLKQIDLFSCPIQLQVKENEQFNTALGTFISMGILIFTFISFVNMTIEMLDRQNPNIVSRIEYNPHPEPQELRATNFYMAFTITDNLGQLIVNSENETYYNIEMKVCQIMTKIDSSGELQRPSNCTQIPMRPCKENNLDKYNIQDDYLQGQSTQIGTCINIDEFMKNPIILFGTTLSPSYQNIAININTQCASKEKIKQKMGNGGFIGIAFYDRLIDQFKPGNPFSPIHKKMILTYNIEKTLKTVQIYLRVCIFKTIENFFYYKPKEFQNQALQFESSNENSDNPIFNGRFAHFNVFLDDRQAYYERTYSNIFNILGDMSGLYGLVVFIFGIFLQPFTKSALNRELSNQIFAFSQIEDSKSNQKEGKIQQSRRSQRRSSLFFKQMRSLQSMTLENNTQIQTKNSNQKNQKELKQFLEQKDKKLHLSNFEYITIICGGYKKRQLNEGIKMIQKKIDVIYIIKKLMEIDKLKALLLTENQLKLFDYIPKPTISIQNNKQSKILPEQFEKEENIYFQEEKKFEEKVLLAIEAYKQIHQNNNNDDINLLDQKLVQMMDKQIQQILHKTIQQEQGYLEKQLIQSIPEREENNQPEAISNDHLESVISSQ